MRANGPVFEAGAKLAGRYAVSRALDAGPTTMVYLCKDEHQGGVEVAIKVFISDLYANLEVVNHFLRWASDFAELKHPYLLELPSISRSESFDFYTLEYMNDGDLSSRLGRETSIEDAVAILSKVASALEHVHQRNIVHRNVKPSNVLFRANGDVKLSESLIARKIGGPVDPPSGGVTASLEYVSPEYLRSNEVTILSDIYALGCLAYELVAGTEPFTGRTVIETMKARLAGRAIPLKHHRPDCPDKLSTIILQAMSSDPRRRFQSAAELRDHLIAV